MSYSEPNVYVPPKRWNIGSEKRATTLPNENFARYIHTRRWKSWYGRSRGWLWITSVSVRPRTLAACTYRFQWDEGNYECNYKLVSLSEIMVLWMPNLSTYMSAAGTSSMISQRAIKFLQGSSSGHKSRHAHEMIPIYCFILKRASEVCRLSFDSFLLRNAMAPVLICRAYFGFWIWALFHPVDSLPACQQAERLTLASMAMKGWEILAGKNTAAYLYLSQLTITDTVIRQMQLRATCDSIIKLFMVGMGLGNVEGPKR